MNTIQWVAVMLLLWLAVAVIVYESGGRWSDDVMGKQQPRVHTETESSGLK